MFKKIALIVAVCLMLVAVIGYAIANESSRVQGFKNLNVQEFKSSEVQECMIAAKPCTPSGWWCTSNSQCCSGKCTNNVCD